MAMAAPSVAESDRGALLQVFECLDSVPPSGLNPDRSRV